jgi:hypothetical protein
MVNLNSWEKIKPQNYQLKFLASIKWLARNPTKVLVFCFFLAAYIRVSKGRLQAWDSIVAIRMLINNFLSVTPNYTVVKVLGVDEVASHTKSVNLESDVYLQDDCMRPSTHLIDNEESIGNADRDIMGHIYEIRARHIFSPIWATLDVSREKLLKWLHEVKGGH